MSLLPAFENVNLECCPRQYLINQKRAAFVEFGPRVDTPTLMLFFISSFLSFLVTGSLTPAYNSSFFSFLGCVWTAACVYVLSLGNTWQQGGSGWPVSRRHHPGYQWREHGADDAHGRSEQDQNLHSAAHTQRQQVWRREKYSVMLMLLTLVQVVVACEKAESPRVLSLTLISEAVNSGRTGRWSLMDGYIMSKNCVCTVLCPPNSHNAFWCFYWHDQSPFSPSRDDDGLSESCHCPCLCLWTGLKLCCFIADKQKQLQLDQLKQKTWRPLSIFHP